MIELFIDKLVGNHPHSIWCIGTKQLSKAHIRNGSPQIAVTELSPHRGLQLTVPTSLHLNYHSDDLVSAADRINVDIGFLTLADFDISISEFWPASVIKKAMRFGFGHLFDSPEELCLSDLSGPFQSYGDLVLVLIHALDSDGLELDETVDVTDQCFDGIFSGYGSFLSWRR